MNVDCRCDGAEDECQESESGNKPLRQGYRVKLPRFLCRNQTYCRGVCIIPFVMKEAMSWAGWWKFLMF